MEFTIPFHPQPIRLAELGAGRIFTLRGPRQVGKTRFLKSLQQRVPSRSVAYESLDIVRTDRELVAVLRRLVRDHRPHLILLDEMGAMIPYHAGKRQSNIWPTGKS